MEKFGKIFFALWIATIICMVILMNLNKKLMVENNSLNTNISYITDEIARVRNAYELRETQYKEIEAENDKLRKDFETIEQNPSQDEKDWLDQAIPAAIDNTIPY
jgi:uncharacterized membrane protein (UPF0182 family)